MKKILLIVMIFAFVCLGKVFPKNLTVLNFSPLPRQFPSDVYEKLKVSVITSLQDLSDFTGECYIDSETAEKWANYKIEEISSTNTKFKKSKVKNLWEIIPVDSNLSVNFAVYSEKAKGQKRFDVSFSFSTRDKKPVYKVVSLSEDVLSDSSLLIRKIKETIVTLYNLENRYYYDLSGKMSGSIQIYVTPKTAQIEIPVLGIKLQNGLNRDIPVGNYVMIVKALGYNSIITNVEIKPQPSVYKISLNKMSKKTGEGIPSLGSIYIDSDFPRARFIIVEDGISGETPMLINEIKSGEKTIIFDETANYTIKTLKTNVMENEITYVLANLERKGNKLIIKSTNENSLVIIDGKIAGNIKDGKFEYQGNVGLHSLTILNDKFAVLKTNFTLEMSKVNEMQLNLTPKKIVGFIVTPQSDNIPVYAGKDKLGSTPLTLYLEETDSLNLEYRATNEGYNILLTNVIWKWGKLNNILATLTPLYGDMKVFSEPGEANVFIEGNYKGKTSVDGLSLYHIQAKRLNLRLEKEGYKPLNTNVYVAPNVENQFKFTLREAPVQIFITTIPEKDFDIYVNDEWSGKSGKTIIPFELGKNTIKITKRGYKTIITNVTLKEKASLVYSFNVEKGLSEEEFVENISNSYELLEDSWKNKKYNEALQLCSNVIDEIKNSAYNYLPVAGEIKKKFESRQGWLIKVTNMLGIMSTGIELENLQDYNNALSAYEEVISILNSFSSEVINYFEETKTETLGRIEKIKGILAEKEEKEGVKNFVVNINKIVLEGDKAQNEGDYGKAVKLYNQALEKIETSGLSDNPKIVELKERINNRLKVTKKIEKEKSDWWPNIKSSWSGFNLSLGISSLSPGGISFNSSEMDLMGYGVIGINFIPFLGIKLGGGYNILPATTSSFAPYAVMGGAVIGIPILPQFGLFGEYFMMISDFTKMNILENSLANFGMELKFDWFGIRLYYEIGFANNFESTYHGVGGGISLWVGEE